MSRELVFAGSFAAGLLTQGLLGSRASRLGLKTAGGTLLLVAWIMGISAAARFVVYGGGRLNIDVRYVFGCASLFAAVAMGAVSVGTDFRLSEKRLLAHTITLWSAFYAAGCDLNLFYAGLCASIALLLVVSFVPAVWTRLRTGLAILNSLTVVVAALVASPDMFDYLGRMAPPKASLGDGCLDFFFAGMALVYAAGHGVFLFFLYATLGKPAARKALLDETTRFFAGGVTPAVAVLLAQTAVLAADLRWHFIPAPAALDAALVLVPLALHGLENRSGAAPRAPGKWMFDYLDLKT